MKSDRDYEPAPKTQGFRCFFCIDGNNTRNQHGQYKAVKAPAETLCDKCRANLSGFLEFLGRPPLPDRTASI